MSFTNLAQSPEKLYLDLQISNVNNLDNLPAILSFTETRTTPILINPQEYYMSVVRFSLDTPSLPIITPTIQYNQGDRNLTIYSLTLSWKNPVAPNQTFTQQTYLQYLPQDLISPIPVPPNLTPTKIQDNSTGYYYIYSYQYWIYLINKTFTTCYNALLAQVTAAALVLPTTHAPVLSYDTQTNIAILNCDLAGYNDTIANHINIFFNFPLYQLFSSFPFYLTSQSSSTGSNVQLQTNTFGNANTIQFPSTTPTYTAIQVFQEYSTVSLWSPVTSIVFCSSTLPIVPTQVASPILILNGNVLGANGNNANQAPVITDFIADGMYKPTLLYEPSAQYRLVSMTGNRPVYTVDINVYWKDVTANLIPFRLTAGSGATIKILFTKKSASNYK